MWVADANQHFAWGENVSTLRKLSRTGEIIMSVSAARQLRHLRMVGLAALGALIVAAAAYGGWHLKLACSPSCAMVTLPPWMVVAAIIFVAAAISSTVGFAFSAIAGAMILHAMPNGVEAVQIMMIASIGIQAYCVANLYQSITWYRCAPFILGGIAAMPVGILLLLHLHPGTYIFAMGTGLITYGLYMLLRRPVRIQGGGVVSDTLVGALGGITGPLAAFPGAFVTIWCGMLGWDKVAQRSVYQPYILALQIIGLGALCAVSHQRTFDPILLGYALPGLAGAIIGLRLFHTMTDTHFHRMVNLALIISGIALVLK